LFGRLLLIRGSGMKRKKRWRTLHYLIIINFLLEIVYGFLMVFFIIGGGKWPMFSRATTIPIEIILKRRLYSLETWVAISGLSIYLAITEIVPRKLKLGKKK
jgi:hypothetical protein